MNRRDLFAALAAAAVAGDALAYAEPGAGPAAAAAADTAPVMGSTVFDWNSLIDKPNENGSARAVCNAATATLKNLEIHITTLLPGHSPHAPHKHPNEELMIVRQGTLEVMQAGEYKHAGPGAVIFNASNVMHGLKNVGTEPAIYHVISVTTAATPAA